MEKNLPVTNPVESRKSTSDYEILKAKNQVEPQNTNKSKETNITQLRSALDPAT